MNLSWMDRAACIGEDPEMFFPNATGKKALRQAEEAAKVCADCPVIAECDDYRQQTGSVGVWGSTLVPSSQFGAVIKTKPEHGTTTGYRKHERLGEKPCEACRTANMVNRSPRGNQRKKWA